MNPGVKIQTPLGIGDVGQLVAAEQAGSNYIFMLNFWIKSEKRI